MYCSHCKVAVHNTSNPTFLLLSQWQHEPSSKRAVYAARTGKGLVVICHNQCCLSNQKGRDMHGFGDNFILVIPIEDDALHTADHPFCFDETCLCHDDQEALSAVNAFVLNGTLTPDEATAFIQGRTV